MRALIIGAGPRVWRDVEEAKRLCNWDRFYVINHVGIHWSEEPFIWVSLHPDKIVKFVRERQDRGLHQDFKVVLPAELQWARTKILCRRVAYRWHLKGNRFSPSGSSGLFAVKIALDDGADHIVLAGIPMSNEPHFDAVKPWTARNGFLRGWQLTQQFYREKTRSISGGWTEELLGRPTQEWFDGEKQDETQFSAPRDEREQFSSTLSQHGNWSRGSTQSWHRRAAQRRRDSSRLRVGDGRAKRR